MWYFCNGFTTAVRIECWLDSEWDYEKGTLTHVDLKRYVPRERSESLAYIAIAAIAFHCYCYLPEMRHQMVDGCDPKSHPVLCRVLLKDGRTWEGMCLPNDQKWLHIYAF